MHDEIIKSPAVSNNSLAPGLNLLTLHHEQNLIKSTQGKATFTHENVVNIYIVNEINLWQFTVGKDFTLGKSSFGTAKLTKYTV